MATLRTPEKGCPWDIEQTFESISHYTIEEAYEVVDAISRNDIVDLKDELGDLLLQVVFHSRIAEEDGHFDFKDVVDAISEKMIRRHPYVFGTEEERAAGPQSGMWDRIKQQEKADKGESPQSVLDGVPVGMPAMTRSVKLQKKAAKAGFDWPSVEPVLNKLREEMDELQEELMPEKQEQEDNATRLEEEYGDILFCVANLGRKLKIDPETAMRKANSKFIRRFTRIEDMMKADGISIEETDLETLDNFWERVKAEERENKA